MATRSTATSTSTATSCETGLLRHLESRCSARELHGRGHHRVGGPGPWLLEHLWRLLRRGGLAHRDLHPRAKRVASIALVAGTGSSAPLLGYVQSRTAAFLVKVGIAGGNWTVVAASGVRSIALAEGTTPSNGLMGYVSSNGSSSRTRYLRRISGHKKPQA